MLKGGRFEMVSEQELFLIIGIVDGWIQRDYETPDLCDTPRFSKPLDYLVPSPKNNRRGQPMYQLRNQPRSWWRLYD